MSPPPVTGFDRVAAGCDRCLAPDTRILTADGAWAAVSTVRVGDQLLSFDEDPRSGRNRLLRLARVEAVWPARAPSITFTTAGGRTVTCSENHRWLSGVRPWFPRADALTLSTQLRAVGDPSMAADLANPDYRAGYVAGVTAGAGVRWWDPAAGSGTVASSEAYWRVAVLETESAVLERLVAYLQAVGVDIQARPFRQAGYGTNLPQGMFKVECRARADLAAIAALLGERASPAWKAGWLAGFFDTDSDCDGTSVGHMPTGDLQRVRRYAADLGYTTAVDRRRRSGATTAPLARHNLHDRLSFLGAIRPALPGKAFHQYLGRRFDADDDCVTALARGPVADLVNLQTSTGTFMAEGLATHSSAAR